MKYICEETFELEEYDDDGFWAERYRQILEGEVFERYEGKDRVVGAPDTVRLDSDKTWLEITEEDLNEYFEKVREGL